MEVCLVAKPGRLFLFCLDKKWQEVAEFGNVVFVAERCVSLRQVQW